MYDFSLVLLYYFLLRRVYTINGVHFFLTSSRVIKLYTATVLTNTKIPTLTKILHKVDATYKAKGFNKFAITAYSSFSIMTKDPDFVLNIKLNITAENEHEPFIERFNMMLKERIRM